MVAATPFLLPLAACTRARADARVFARRRDKRGCGTAGQTHCTPLRLSVICPRHRQRPFSPFAEIAVFRWFISRPPSLFHSARFWREDSDDGEGGMGVILLVSMQSGGGYWGGPPRECWNWNVTEEAKGNWGFYYCVEGIVMWRGCDEGMLWVRSFVQGCFFFWLYTTCANEKSMLHRITHFSFNKNLERSNRVYFFELSSEFLNSKKDTLKIDRNFDKHIDYIEQF